MQEVAENIYLQHSYDFKNFKDSVSSYSFEIDNEKKYIVFYRMTFVVIHHNLSIN